MKNILWFNQVDHNDLALVGGKGANLGEMYKIKIPVPNGFVVTAQSYFDFIKTNQLMDQIRQLLKSTDIKDPNQLLSVSKKIRRLIEKSPMPDHIAIDIMKAYKKLSRHGGLANVAVAVRSSATAEDLPDASFAGQQDTFLNVVGEANLIKRVQNCWSSLFTPRAIFYRENKHFDHFKVGIAVPVQKMVQSEISGVMFTVNPVTNQKDQIIVETVWGLGEYIVQGTVTPDQYIINKRNWTVESFTPAVQTRQLLKSNDETKEKPVPKYKQKKAKIDSKLAIKIAKIGQKLHNHYAKPQDIEFAIEKSKVYIVQTRPITTLNNSKSINHQNQINIPADFKGDSASPGFASGKVVILKNAKNLDKLKKGDILVSVMTSPDFVPAMKKAAGIITDKGGQTSHAAIVSRELGTPCVVGTKVATKKLKDGDIVTLDGSTGRIWFGDLTKNFQQSTNKKQTGRSLKTATKIYVNLGEPELAKEISQRHVDGIGLLRAEFMIANIGIHPKHIIARG
ncbi:phosphoenolpyruvate synthase, partial [Candidatus Shapirobacteria bacterium]